jgi:glycosyltransferase involved in cell wall biosynthesis
MSALRVMFVCHGHPRLVPGGTEWVAHDLFRGMRDDGLAQATFLGCVSPLHRTDRAETRFQAIGRTGDELLLWVGGFDRFGLAQTEPLPTERHLRTLLGHVRPQIVHFHHFSRIGLEALLTVRRVLPQARIVVTLHDYHLICANDGLMLTEAGTPCRTSTLDRCRRCLPGLGGERWVARELYVRNLLKLVDQFIAPSRFLKERHVAWGLPRAKISLIGNALPEAHAIPAAAAQTAPRPRRTFGFFGNIAPHKGVLTALAAIGTLGRSGCDAALVLHGGMHFPEDAFRRAFADALEAAQPFAWHAGPYEREDLGTLMARIDWVVVPSTWWENAPLVILEAFRHRRPVICSDIGGMAEMVEDGVSGLHFAAGNPHALAVVMRRALTEPGLWDRLVGQSPRVPALKGALARHIALYNTLLANSGHASSYAERREASSA